MIKIKKLHPNFKLPTYSTEGSACRDIILPEAVVIGPNSVNIVPLGFSVQVPYGYELQLRARSGLSSKIPGYLANGIGTIDSDYVGEVCCIFYNPTNDLLQFQAGQSICQCVIKECTPFDFEMVDELDNTDRGEGGFGSTGR